MEADVGLGVTARLDLGLTAPGQRAREEFPAAMPESLGSNLRL